MERHKVKYRIVEKENGHFVQERFLWIFWMPLTAGRRTYDECEDLINYLKEQK